MKASLLQPVELTTTVAADPEPRKPRDPARDARAQLTVSGFLGVPQRR